jgi:hypothetical protein
LRVRDKTLTPDDVVERRFPTQQPAQEHLYQSQEAWLPVETEITLYYLGVVAPKE